MNAKRTDVVEIFTDGACKGNPGVGGWGALLQYNGHTRELFGGEKLTTNNRMELLAVIRALEALTTAMRSAAAHRFRICAEGHQRMDTFMEKARLANGR